MPLPFSMMEFLARGDALMNPFPTVTRCAPLYHDAVRWSEVWGIRTREGRWLAPVDRDEGAVLAFPSRELAERAAARQAERFFLDGLRVEQLAGACPCDDLVHARGH